MPVGPSGMDQSDLSALVKQKIAIEKVVKFQGLSKLAGGQRLRFSSDTTTNALTAIKVLLGEEAYRDSRTVVNSVRHVLRENKLDDHGAVLALALKTVDAYIGDLAGLYTLWNKVVLTTTTAEDLREIFGARMDSWMLKAKDDTVQMEIIKKQWPRLMAIRVGQMREPIPFKDFLLNTELWATSGAVDVKELVMNGLSNTKAGFALSLSPERLWSWWITNKNAPVKWSTVQKSEPGAVRLVVLTDLVTYLKMAYIGYILEPSLTNHPYLYNYMTPDARLAWWNDCASYSGREGFTHLQGDYSNFDASECLSVLNWIREQEITMLGKLDADAGLETLTNQMSTATMILPWGEFLVQNGLPSGSRDTTRMNSYINACVIMEVVERMGLNIAKLGVLGDDSEVVVYPSTGLTVDDFAKYFEECTLTLNPNKSKLTPDRFEFLKMTCSGLMEPRGSPMRAIRALLYSSESEEGNNTMIEKWNGRVTLWTKFISRVRADPEYYANLIVHDLTHAVPKNERLPKDGVILWLTTPSCLGGGGLFKPIDVGLQVLPIEIDRSKVRVPSVPQKMRRYREGMHQAWRRGLNSRVMSVMNKREKINYRYKYRAIERYNQLLLYKSKLDLSYYASFEPPVPPRPPDVRLDDATRVLDGCRNNRELRQWEEEYLTVGGRATCDIMRRRLTLGLYTEWLRGRSPYAMPAVPALTLRYGEVFDAYAASVATNYIWLISPRKLSYNWLTYATTSIEISADRFRRLNWVN